MTAKIVCLDIETASLEAYTWGMFDQTIQLNMIKKDWRILCFAWKWLHSDHVGYSEARTEATELDVLAHLWKVLDEADVVVAHNGKRFDIKKINARLIQSGFPPYSPVKVVDTLLEARKVAAFTSNKLEYLADILTDGQKLKHSKFPGFELWSECLDGNPFAWEEMQEYNKQDVLVLEKVYKKLLPWMANHPNLGNYVDSKKPVCPKCGGDDLRKRGVQRTQVGQYQRYRCHGCGGWSRGRKMLKTGSERDHIVIGQ